MEEHDLTWKSYEMDMDLYKFYLDMALKMAVFVFAITGGIVSYYVANAASQPWTRVSLALPLLMNVTFGLIYWRGIWRSQSLVEGNRNRANKLGIPTLDLESLPWLLKVLTLLFLLVSLSLSFLIAAGQSIFVLRSCCS